MLRSLELALFLSPFLLFVLWRVATLAGWPSGRVVSAAFVMLVLMLGGLLWFQQEGALPTGSTYVPATLRDGRIVPGHGSAPP